ncbi:MAG: alpha-L-fucosidase [Ruminococcaceae bacterium]|nr:alpha-L-fucosidase [Oscillospiraceae bacterium]
MALPVPAQYVLDFEQMGFGMFVHWGLYSQLGRGEWVYKVENMDMAEYKKLADTFTAEDFDADELVLTAKNAGCRYICFTSRHHEGFSLYDTRGLNDFDVMHTPCGRDLVGEFVDACHRHGISPFLYHTTRDWYNPDFVDNFDRYLDYLYKSVEILCTHYGKIGGFWFDGNSTYRDADWKETRLYSMIRKYQPEAILLNNMGINSKGVVSHPDLDVIPYERGNPRPMNREGMPKYLAAEMCDTINDHWSIGINDFNYKSPARLINNICRCRKAGANYLLNIGPTAEGGVQPYQRELMALIGRWMEIFGEAVYSGRPYGAVSYGAASHLGVHYDSNDERCFILKGEGKLYIFCVNTGIAGDENVTMRSYYCGSYAFDNVPDRVKSVRWMDSGEELSFVQQDDTLVLRVTPQHYGSSFCVRVAEAEI